jgi:hypothetical protein
VGQEALGADTGLLGVLGVFADLGELGVFGELGVLAVWGELGVFAVFTVVGVLGVLGVIAVRGLAGVTGEGSAVAAAGFAVVAAGFAAGLVAAEVDAGSVVVVGAVAAGADPVGTVRVVVAGAVGSADADAAPATTDPVRARAPRAPVTSQAGRGSDFMVFSLGRAARRRCGPTSLRERDEPLVRRR